MTESTPLTDFPPPSSQLAGQVALVTGASSGLGERFARLLAAAGAKVACAARRADRLDALVTSINTQGGDALAVTMDVGEEASIIAGYDAIAAGFGQAPTIVVANAGMNARGLSVDITADDFDALMDVNVRGVFLTAREGARRMIAGGSATGGAGRIVLIGSMGGIRPLPGLVPYSVSKAAVIMMGKAMAREMARNGINVNTLCPGYVETEINAEWLQEPGGQKMIQGFPRRRVMEADALDGAFLYLCSPAARYTTGSVVEVHDGQGL
jgi:NAD(P)-dependent dehydrogenase (short-subunit alcohol dehydrogenase family)